MSQKVLESVTDSVVQKGSQRGSLLQKARMGHFFMVKQLVDAGFEVNRQNRNGKTALILAIEGCRRKIAMFLIKSGSNIYLEDNFGNSALRLAWELDEEIFNNMNELLLDIVKKDCKNNSVEVAEKLISVNCPIYIAVFARDAEVTRIMLEKGCSPNNRSTLTGRRALHRCVIHKIWENAKLLIEYGVDVNCRDSHGKIPVAYYHSRTASTIELDVLEMFIDRVNTWTTMSCDGRMQLNYVVRCTIVEVLDIFFKSNIDWFAEDAEGITPLQYFLLNKNLLIPNLYNETFSKHVFTDDYLDYVLVQASLCGLVSLVSICLENGANPNEILGETGERGIPLIVATTYEGDSIKRIENMKETCILLFQYGADPQYYGDNNYTLLDRMMDCNTIYSVESVIGHLAISESLGRQLLVETKRSIGSYPLYRDQFQLSKSQLQNLKQTKVVNSISAYELLTANARKLIVYARNKQLIDKWASFEECSNSYYAHIIKVQLQKTRKIIQFHKEIPGAVWNAMGLPYESFPNIIDKITEYIIF